MDLLRMVAERTPDKPAILFQDTAISFAELDAMTDRLVSGLRGRGVEPGDRLAWVLNNRPAVILLGQACRRLGVIGIPVNFRLTVVEIGHQLRDSGAKLVAFERADQVSPLIVTPSEVPDVRTWTYLGHGDAPSGTVPFDDLAGAEPGGGAAEVDLISAPSLQYTAGTTGLPKGAYRAQGMPLSFLANVVTAYGLGSDDVHLTAGPLYHAAPAAFAAVSLALGATVVLMPRFDATEALRLIGAHGVTTAFMVPIMLKRIADVRDAPDTSTLRVLVVAGAPCAYSVKEATIGRFGEVLYEFYGSTETGMNLLLRPEDQLRKPGSAGLPFPGNEILLVDENGKPVVTPGRPGTLYVRGDALSDGYWHNPDATDRALLDGFMTVGDIATVDEEGYYTICDRAIDMIISGGSNVYSAEVEAALLSHPAVRDVAVIGVPDDEWGERVHAVVQPQPGVLAGVDDLEQHARKRLAGYKVPRTWEFLDDFPRDAMGKVLKRSLRERVAAPR